MLKKIKELGRMAEVSKGFFAAAKNEDKEARLGASFAANKFDACFDATYQMV